MARRAIAGAITGSIAVLVLVVGPIWTPPPLKYTLVTVGGPPPPTFARITGLDSNAKGGVEVSSADDLKLRLLQAHSRLKAESPLMATVLRADGHTLTIGLGVASN